MENSELKILIIDDEFAALKKMEIMLSKFGKCDTATTGAEALKLISTAIDNEYYNLITFDIGLPDINGIELLIIILAEEKKYNVTSKKLMISASGTTDNVIRSVKENKCEGFLVKPVKKTTLYRKLSDIGITTII